MNLNRIALLLRNSPAALLAVARSKKNGSTPKDWFSGLSDETWLWMNTTGRRRLPALAAIVPGMPNHEMQLTFTGNTEDSTLKAGFAAYRLFKSYYERHVGEIGSCRGILDFGCGWGRIIRFFLRDVPPDRIRGVDHSEEAIRACRETNPWCNFALIEPHPPTPLPSESFELIYLYSVFSHLPEEMHLALLPEFQRLLIPGGLLIATTYAREFILFCASSRNKQRWDELGMRFRDEKRALAAYDRGEFCYDARGTQGRWSFWGEACIPRAYTEKRWTEFFDVLDFIDDRDLDPQNVIVARKRPAIGTAGSG